MSGVVEAVFRGVSLALAFGFLLSLAHKFRIVFGEAPASEPVTRAIGLRGRAVVVALLASVIVEIGLAGALVMSPTVGFAATTAVLLVYTVAVRRLDARGSCHCFGAGSHSTRRQAVVRNLCLASVSAVGATLYGFQALVVAPASQASVGVALIFVLASSSFVIVRRLSSSEMRQPTYGGGRAYQ